MTPATDPTLVWALLEALDSGLIVLDGDRRIVFWNEWIAAATGIDASAAVGEPIEKLGLGPGAVRVAAAVDQALETGASRLFTSSLHPALLPLRTHAGRPMVHNTTVRPIGARPPSHCLVQISDVTTASQREAVLRQRQNARYDAVVGSAPDPILTMDVEGLIQQANPAAATEFGYPAEALAGRPLTDFLRDAEGWGYAWRRVLAGLDVHWPVELAVRRSDGTLSYVDASASRWMSEARPYVTVILRDVNERRAAEAELRGLNETLEERVRERTADLERAHEQLRQSQKMEAIGQLTGGVAHDFNNLLTIIRSATDFLRRRELPEERRRRYVDAISDTVERASKLTAQLLAFARRQPLKPQIFNVGSQVEGVAQLVRPLVGGRIEISVEVQDTDCFTVADVAQFETALINLAINARDAMDGEGRLTIAVRKVQGIPSLRAQSARGGDYVAISVADTGSGIAPENIDAIFEPFFTTKEVGKGTGLGLSQAFGFAKQSEGDIAVTSTPRKGATFTIYLPQAQSPAAESEAAALTSEAATTGRGYRVLVVEDNDDVGQFSTELLEDLGYVVRRVANASAALAILGENEFAVDLVFSDVIMPGMNGVELAGLIRERYPGLPVVLTSGYSNVLAENAHRGFELIQKPYSVESLSRILRKAITEKLSVAR